MYDAKTLKPLITISQTHVECPVKGCSRMVERQRRSFRREKRFQCPEHGIYISPTTFEYRNESDNLLWTDHDDLKLHREIKGSKRESRMARDNSEDSLSWNVFRYLEKGGLLGSFLSSLVQIPVDIPELIYWSYSSISQRAWPGLDAARLEFGENLQRSSEPDLIAVTPNSLFFIEAKLTAANKTHPSNLGETKRYLTGGNAWFSRVFRAEYNEIAIQAQKYELLRFWLLGTWIAAQTGRSFYLVNLVRAEKERNIENLFGQYIYRNDLQHFLRLSWEEIFKFISDTAQPSTTKTTMMDYFENKTIGYDHFGQLKKAFQLPSF